MAKHTTFFFRQGFKFIPLLAVFISLLSFGQTTQSFTAPGSYTFTVPAGVNTIKVEAWGGGSGGNNDISRGGGGGAFAGDNTLSVTPGASYTVRVGSGGAAGTGNSGQDSSFGNLIVAKGGNGATGGSATASTGAVRYSGGNGGSSSRNGGAGGGGSAGSQGDGGTGGSTNNTNGAVGGTAGAGGGAAGGNGGNTNQNGSNGGFPGGGGGERGSNGTSIGSGAGGNGQVIITYTPAYLAQIISADTGPSTWCAGETRTVSVTIKNIGTQAWTDGGGKDFNIGIKWNTNGSSWPDYHVRVDAGNLAPGATRTYFFTVTASNNVNGAYTTPLAAGTNNLTFDVVYEGVAWFGNNPAGTTGVGPGNAVFTTPNQTITPITSVGNNILSYSNGTSGQQSATPAENGNTVLTAPAGTYFATVNFASYGTPGGTAPNFSIGSCHAATSQSVTEGYLLGNSGPVTIPATNAVFGDPCVGTLKRLYVSASYAQAVCTGTSVSISGSTPTGGNGIFTYLWESSTTSATAGFAPAAGANSGINYTSGALTQTTWFRRYVSSGCASGYSAVVMVKVNPTPVMPTININAATCSTPGTATISNYAAANTYTFSPAGPSVNSSGTVTGFNYGTTYTVTARNASGCISAASAAFTIAAQLSTPAVPTVTTTAATCSAPGTATISNYAATNTYTFSPSGPTVGSGGIISGLAAGTNYTVTSGNGSCTSAASLSFTIAAQLPTPAVPAIVTTGATCSSAGTATISNYAATNTYTFSPSGPTVGSGGIISGLFAGTSYTVTSGNGTCTSAASTSFSIEARWPAPTVTLTSGAGTNNQTVCSSDAVTPVTYTATGITSATVTGLPAGLTGSFAAGVFTISGTPTVSGTFNYTVTFTGTCGTLTENGIITVNPTPSAAVSAIGSGQICTVADVGFNIVGTPAATVIYQLNGGVPVSLTLPVSGVAQVTVSAASASQTLTLLSVSNGICTAALSGSSSTATVNFSVTTWNGTDWDNGLPDNTKMAVFAADYSTTNGNITACGCQTNAGVTLTIGEGTFMEILRNIINNGTIVVKSDANLLQKSEGGTYTAGADAKFMVERSVSGVKNNLTTGMDYIYWSAPVTGQNLQDFSPGTPRNRIFEYTEATDLFKQAPESEFIKGKGYAFRAEGGLSNPYAKTYIFTGIPNNGLVRRGVTKSPNTGTGGTVEHGYNLIGNPYPSNINVDQFFINNASVIHGTAWFWTNTAYVANQQGSSYSGNNYAVYNGTGGTGATGGTVAPNGIVKVGQGFLVQAKTAGTVEFRNSYGAGDDLRVADAGNFYQRGNEKNRFWLELLSPDNILNSQLIGYVPGATNGFEKDYDAEILGMSSDLFYSKVQDYRLIIQGKGVFTYADKVSLGANFFRNGNYTILLKNTEGIFANGQAIYLKDRQTGAVTNLSEGSYIFTASKGISEDRFEIIYQPETVLATDAEQQGTLEVYRDGGDFTVRSSHKRIAALEVYDASGRMMYSSNPFKKETVIPGDLLVNGIYLVKTELEDGQRSVKKIRK